MCQCTNSLCVHQQDPFVYSLSSQTSLCWSLYQLWLFQGLSIKDLVFVSEIETPHSPLKHLCSQQRWLIFFGLFQCRLPPEHVIIFSWVQLHVGGVFSSENVPTKSSAWHRFLAAHAHQTQFQPCTYIYSCYCHNQKSATRPPLDGVGIRVWFQLGVELMVQIHPKNAWLPKTLVCLNLHVSFNWPILLAERPYWYALTTSLADTLMSVYLPVIIYWYTTGYTTLINQVHLAW